MTPLPTGPYACVLADPPWQFQNLWNTPAGPNRGDAAHYGTMSLDEIAALPVREIVADDAALFMWCIWILMPKVFPIIEAWGFTYKSCAFDWMKADVRQADMFKEDADVQMGLGYWTRANSEPCLLATRGKPQRLSKSVRQGIISPRREHSRKPDCIYERIERLVAGPRLELFARTRREGWDSWGNETDRFAPAPLLQVAAQ